MSNKDADSRDILIGLTDVDELNGGGGRDFLYGGDGNDILIGGAGNDELWGGDLNGQWGTTDGTDRADYSGAPGKIDISVSFGTEPSIFVDDGEGGIDTLHSIEEIIGTASRDELTVIGEIPTGFTLTVDANGGQGSTPKDTIRVSGEDGFEVNIGTGSGFIQAKDGSGGKIDLLNFKTNIFGSDGDDLITDDSDGEKRIDGGDGNDEISVSTGDAIIKGDWGEDIINGGDGNDVLTGGEGKDELNGGGGSDRLIADTDLDKLDGGDGHDWLEAAPEAHGSLTYRGGRGNDVLDLRNGAPWNIPSFDIALTAEDGHDYVIGDWLRIGTLDLSSVNRNQVTVVWDMTIIEASEPHPELYWFAEVTGDLAITINGTGASLLLEDVHGFVHGGGLEVDLNNIIQSLVQVLLPTIEFADGVWTPEAQADDFTLIQFQAGTVAPYATAPDDFDGATDSGDPDQGGAGDDDLSGGSGNDTFESSGGNDSIDGGAGTDVFETMGGSFDFAFDGVTLVITDQEGTEGTTRLTNVEKVYSLEEDYWTYVGTAGDDTMAGTGGSETLLGGLGADLFHANSGDKIEGGAGNDRVLMLGGGNRIDGEAGNDKAIYSGSSSDYAVEFFDGYVALTHAGGVDRLWGMEVIEFHGDNTVMVLGLGGPMMMTMGDMGDPADQSLDAAMLWQDMRSSLDSRLPYASVDMVIP